MLTNMLHVYRSAAGSGKTRTLAKSYLTLALRFGGDYFKHILAVTFTNKATQEMKERILQYLADFSNKKYNTLSQELCDELHLTEQQLSCRSTDLLSQILHNYSSFSISTIDSFFQRILRSFSRESGFLGDFQLELDIDLVLHEVLKKFMDELGESEQLIAWVVAFARHRLMAGKSWEVEQELSSFSREIFKERFKVIEGDIVKPLEGSNPHKEKLEVLQKEINSFERYMQKRAVTALTILSDQSIEKDHFKYGNNGTALKYFQEFSKRHHYSSTGARLKDALEGGSNWYKKTMPSYTRAVELTDKDLVPILQDMVLFDEQKSTSYFSAKAVVERFYAYGLIADIAQKLDEYRREHNLLLISDVSMFIHNIIADNDVTFLYEKIGSYFFHYLIDEFQDTSVLQWKNFFPLLKEALDQGRSCFLVGDIKQSIYRWRGGEPNLLQHEVPRSIGQGRIKENHLNVNYRSAYTITRFNNTLFKEVSNTVSDLVDSPLAREAYSHVEQQAGSSMQDSGYVRIEFLPKESSEKISLQEAVLNKLPALVEELQDKGVRLGDIALLTRKKEEGQRIATTFLDYKNNCATSNYRYDVVSDESLQLDVSPSVKLLLSALRYIHAPYDAVAHLELVYRIKKTVFTGTPSLRYLFPDLTDEEALPDEMRKKMHAISKFSIYEMVEELITLFRLYELQHEQAYLQGFQHIVLEFSFKKQHDLTSFLTYWENTGSTHSVQASGDIDAMHILTIHKAKGLQFKCVIIPFMDWKLDHESGKQPLLWVKSKHCPFEDMGMLAVRYSKALEKTYFSEAYYRERAGIYLDNLNLLYVSFTRAESTLVVYAPKPSNSSKKLTTVGELVHLCLNKTYDRDSSFNGDTFCMGNMEMCYEVTPSYSTLPFTWERYARYPWHEQALSLLEDRDGLLLHDRKKKTDYGKKVHELLALLHYKDEADRVLHQFCMQNMFDEKERVKLSEVVRNVLTHPVASTWFDRKWVVKTEVTILRLQKEPKRIDRIMTKGRETVIIDYKTGDEVEEDQHQVREYIRLMGEMGHACTAHLLYLASMKIVSVKSPPV